MAEIDAPESHQPYGSRAKQALSGVVFGKEVQVVVVDTDRYGRTVGRVYVGTLDVSAEMVRQGAAWVFRRYNRDPALPPLEQTAREARRGLWALSEAERMPPWEWRAAARAKRQRGLLGWLWGEPMAQSALLLIDGAARGGIRSGLRSTGGCLLQLVAE